MTYADYAHRGAYPLIVTALLAAGFVLVAMRPGGPAESSRLIRRWCWPGSRRTSCWSISVDPAARSLCRGLFADLLRVAAFIWMGLVALGLVLILSRIAPTRPNSWLITANPSRWRSCSTPAASSIFAR